MVPPGVQTFSGMKFATIHLPSSTVTRSCLSTSLSPEKWLSSSYVSSILSDHAYALRSPGGCLGDGTTCSYGCSEASTGVRDDSTWGYGCSEASTGVRDGTTWGYGCSEASTGVRDDSTWSYGCSEASTGVRDDSTWGYGCSEASTGVRDDSTCSYGCSESSTGVRDGTTWSYGCSEASTGARDDSTCSYGCSESSTGVRDDSTCSYGCSESSTGVRDDMTWGYGCSEASTGVRDDEEFSSRMFGLHDAGESTDVDFLSGLEDLDFDLEPCDDVEMADSLQDFIDSALEDSCCSSLPVAPTSDSTQESPRQGGEDISKETFLSSLCLRSTHVQTRNSDLSYEKGSGKCRSASSSDEDTQIVDRVPTKRCSCMISERNPKAVYSMAQADLESGVRTSPSTLVTNSSDNSCTNCLNRLAPTRVMSPLFIDTSFGQCSQSLLSSPGDSFDTSVHEQDSANTDNDTTDVTAWLSESQSENYYNDSLHEKYDNTVFALPDNVASSLDLESFVDLDNYMDADLQQRTTPSCPCDNSQLHLANKDAQSSSPLQLSFLEQHQDDKRCSSFEFNSHLRLCQSVSPRSGWSESSILSPCSSPAWSMTDSSQLSPLGNLHPPGSRTLDNIVEDFSVKGQLALLNLFSEENAESLLLAESSVPTIRFV